MFYGAGFKGLLNVVVTLVAKLRNVTLDQEFPFGSVRIVAVGAFLSRRHVNGPVLSESGIDIRMTQQTQRRGGFLEQAPVVGFMWIMADLASSHFRRRVLPFRRKDRIVVTGETKRFHRIGAQKRLHPGLVRIVTRYTALL